MDSGKVRVLEIHGKGRGLVALAPFAHGQDFVLTPPWWQPSHIQGVLLMHCLSWTRACMNVGRLCYALQYALSCSNLTKCCGVDSRRLH